MEIPLTKQYFDEQFEFLARTVKEGFDATATKDELRIVKDDLRGVEERLGQRISRIEATMVTKSYLDDKLADLKGDIIVKMRKLDGHLAFIEDLLKSRAVLSDADVSRARTEFQIFPTLAA